MIQHKFGYPSLAEMVRRAVTDESKLAKDERRSRDDGADWFGATFEDARKLATNGDVEGARKLSKVALETVDSVMRGSPRLDPVFRLDEGQWIDVARFIKGEPECWGAMVESEPTIRRGVALIINASIMSAIRAEEIRKVGAQIGGAVLALQAQGHAVTVYAAEKLARGETTLLLYAPINPGATFLDLSHLSTVLQPWFLRRILFSLQETEAYDSVRREYGFRNGGGYGTCGTLNKADERTIAPEQDQVVSLDIGEICARGLDAREYIQKKLNGGK